MVPPLPPTGSLYRERRTDNTALELLNPFPNPRMPQMALPGHQELQHRFQVLQPLSPMQDQYLVRLLMTLVSGCRNANTCELASHDSNSAFQRHHVWDGF